MDAAAPVDDFGEDDPFMADAGPAPSPQPAERVIDPVFEDLQDEVPGLSAAESLYGEVDNDVPDQPVPRISVGAFCERPETGALKGLMLKRSRSPHERLSPSTPQAFQCRAP